MLSHETLLISGIAEHNVIEDRFSSENQGILRKLVDREVICNVSYLISEITKLAACASYNENDSDLNYEELLDMGVVRNTPEQYKQAAIDNCYKVIEINGEYFWYEEDEFGGKVPLKDVPEDYAIDEGKISEEFAVFYDDDLQEAFASREEALSYVWSDFFSKEGKDSFDDEEDAWKDCCEENNLEPEDYDVFEHWFVTSWFADKLRGVGEQVVDFCCHDVWCRTCTGQAILLDPCIAEIAEDMEILVGQSRSWAEECQSV